MRPVIAPWLLVLVACASSAPRTPEPAPSAGGETPAAAGPRVVGQAVSYTSGGTTLEGYIAWDDARRGKRPGVVVVHEWWGHNDYARRRAEMLAALGYTALAVDMYGDGKTAAHPNDAQAFMQAATADLAVTAARFEAGLEVLKQHETTDPERIAAIGYCFGGAVVLNMARRGADLDVVGSFHGVLGAWAPAEAGAIGAEVLVFTGEADPMVPAAVVDGFRTEMEHAGARYTIVSYPGALHSFTNPAATELGKKFGLPAAYDEAADTDSWTKLTQALAARFSAPEPTAEEKAAAKEAAKNRGDLAKMEAQAAAEKARWTDAMRAEAKALAETQFASTRAALRKILKGSHRAPGNAARDADRHPVETLSSFGIRPDMTVFEYGPGAGWYTELLAPLLAQRGKLIVNNGDPDGPREERGTYYAKRLELFLESSPELYGKVEVVRIADPKTPSLGLQGTVDAALVMRGYHGWRSNGTAGKWLAELHRALKPKGILAIEQHRAADDADPEQAAADGRVSQASLIAEVEAAGFELVGKSEVNANRKDDRTMPVWNLPPTLRLGDTDREKYLAIGESDRMTLKFVRSDAPAK